MWKLVIEDDEGKRTVVPLTREQYSIGRKEGNTIRLTERNVSRDHARLFRQGQNGPPSGSSRGGGTTGTSGAPADGGTFVLEDLTSYNGVFVNGLRISHAQGLAHGDLVQIGDYRIVLHDDALADAGTASNDTKATVPHPSGARASALLDRPNRLVMLAGPTPGAEFPLDRERLTLGRAEDATISINHNSVSRLHCEVHALGDGRFEIVDKGSSNGVHVNSAELRRGIVEPGDIIELGDVKFKFVGAGQIFRPTESQQLSLLGNRDAAALVHGRRSTAVPFAIFAVVVGIGAATAWVFTRPSPDQASLTSPPAQPARDEGVLANAKHLCDRGDCIAAHDTLAAIPAGSPVRASPDFADIENRWADELLARADAEPAASKKRPIYQRVAQAMTVDALRRKAAADKLVQLDSTASAIAVSASPTAPSATPKSHNAAEHIGPARSNPEHHPPSAAEAAVSAAPSPAPAAPPSSSAAVTDARPASTSVDERERELALAGTQDAKMALKQQLEQRVYSGKATDTELNLLISTCKDLGDKPCVEQARAVKGQRQASP